MEPVAFAVTVAVSRFASVIKSASDTVMVDVSEMAASFSVYAKAL